MKDAAPVAGGARPSKVRQTVAAYLGVRNCADLLAVCLQHLTWVDEVLVADASTDDRIARVLAERYPAVKRVVDRTDDHRLRLDNQVANIESDFVLLVDADEFYTPEAGTEILAALRTPCAYDAFRIPSVSYLFGECIGPGATQLRLFRKDRYRWPMRSPHEMPHVDGQVAVLTVPYHHHNSPSLSVMPMKAFRYEAAQARLLDDASINRLALDNKSAMAFWSSVLLEWARMNVRFLRALWGNRRLGFVGLCLAYGQIMQVIVHHVCPTEERRMRAGIITRDRHGYL